MWSHFTIVRSHFIIVWSPLTIVRSPLTIVRSHFTIVRSHFMIIPRLGIFVGIQYMAPVRARCLKEAVSSGMLGAAECIRGVMLFIVRPTYLLCDIVAHIQLVVSPFLRKKIVVSTAFHDATMF